MKFQFIQIQAKYIHIKYLYISNLNTQESYFSLNIYCKNKHFIYFRNKIRLFFIILVKKHHK